MNKNVLKYCKDAFNSSNLPTNDTINGIKNAVTTYQTATKAIKSHEMEKDQNIL